MTNKTYDKLKQIVQIVLPALGTLYFTLAGLWHLPHPKEVVGSVSAVALFLGVLLQVYNKKYWDSDEQYDGTLAVSESDSSKIFGLEITTDPDQLSTQKVITLRRTVGEIPGLHEIANDTTV